ncbi:hypothetical protein SAMN02949497_1431 [Methylomagnum ishizawai]|uniref:Lipoprotein-attachment site-containing protein n=1 Tax=Methylomagnum ishizawai TaxID=1760988 RepID=A0A1Y6D144_9GAMM|nr:hypothetical protein [Methylomagnum ishizawai]SMF94124.1 hypothetical protein SAMN02949497_1431 [Methylomagnum ishizawai]
MSKKYWVGWVLSGLALALVGCGGEGPLGNTPPQGRPEWMKKKENTQPAPAQPEAPPQQ